MSNLVTLLRNRWRQLLNQQGLWHLAGKTEAPSITSKYAYVKGLLCTHGTLRACPVHFFWPQVILVKKKMCWYWPTFHNDLCCKYFHLNQFLKKTSFHKILFFLLIKVNKFKEVEIGVTTNLLIAFYPNLYHIVS